jgi:hypothetical protein
MLYSSPMEWLRQDVEQDGDTLAGDFVAAHPEMLGLSPEEQRGKIKAWYVNTWNEAQAQYVERRYWEDAGTPAVVERIDSIPREKALRYVDEETLGRILADADEGVFRQFLDQMKYAEASMAGADLRHGAGSPSGDVTAGLAPCPGRLSVAPIRTP